MMTDYYVLLGVGMDAKPQELQAAFERYASKATNPEEIKAIKETLLNPASKANYDLFLRQNYPSRYAK
ncbi:hypothetical protein [Dichelobacter nodosus]|uniref:J domain-containing protein n=1 Tax=Dichelobacter nodosus (strain VCS1703A) TaxID=246195 RepID=A5EW19_DICNV|nr:hypothetical protein [Dichelobacter nodosus]ABQ13244.1 hypothetical protein DNO_0357 [Dichelobacter nodosus VCS1703A]TGA65450.1 hypothetical protein E5E99_03235 [Dichelobacter nodosus]